MISSYVFQLFCSLTSPSLRLASTTFKGSAGRNFTTTRKHTWQLRIPCLELCFSTYMLHVWYTHLPVHQWAIFWLYMGYVHGLCLASLATKGAWYGSTVPGIDHHHLGCFPSSTYKSKKTSILVNVFCWLTYISAKLCPYIYIYTYWLVVWTPLKNMSQLGWLETQYMGKYKMATKPTTSIYTHTHEYPEMFIHRSSDLVLMVESPAKASCTMYSHWIIYE